MKIDLSCPIEVRGYALSCSDRGMQAVVRLYNLTDRRIASIEAVARWQCTPENRKIVCPFSMEHMNACGRSFFQITLDNNRMPDADNIEILFNTVRFEDGDPEWHAGNGPFAEMAPLPPLNSEEMMLLKSVGGDDAVCWPKQNDAVWTCVCGRMNPFGTDMCARCHRSMNDAMACTPEYAQEQLNRAAEPTIPVEVLERRFERRRSRLFQRTLLFALVALAVTAFLVVCEQPAPKPTVLNASAAAIETLSFKN